MTRRKKTRSLRDKLKKAGVSHRSRAGERTAQDPHRNSLAKHKNKNKSVYEKWLEQQQENADKT